MAAAAAAVLLLTSVAPAAAVAGLVITTPFPSVEVDPGSDVTFPLTVTTTNPEVVTLAVTDAPEGFDTIIRGGGSTVGSYYSGAEVDNLELKVDVPAEATSGDYPVVLRATGSAGSTDLPLTVTVREGAGGTVSLTSDVPLQRGDTGTTFTFNATLSNDTSQELTFTLNATGEPGWDVSAEFAGEAQAGSITVAAGDTQTINVTAVPPADAQAGTYPVSVQTSGGSQSASLDFAVELTGTFSMTLTTADGRLNTTVTGGGSSTVNLVLNNTGSSDLANVALTSTPPEGWEVTFDPVQIDVIPATQTVNATATVTPRDNSVTGDYQITISASGDDVDDQQIELRTTVETSSLWGAVGLGVIGLVLLGLFLVFRRYGRR